MDLLHKLFLFRNKRFINLAPGSFVPKSGEYKCNVCMEGGMLDAILKAFIKKNVIKGAENLIGNHEDVKIVKRMMKEDKELRRSLEYPTDQQLEGKETIKFFQQGNKFTECPNCGRSSGWTLLELTHKFVHKYKNSK